MEDLMSTKDNGGPAFPCQDIIRRNDRGGLHGPEISSDGISVRDYFAAKVASGDAAQGDDGWGNSVSDESIMTRACLYYRIADAMLKARQS
jgi:hypothetical protein